MTKIKKPQHGPSHYFYDAKRLISILESIVIAPVATISYKEHLYECLSDINITIEATLKRLREALDGQQGQL